MKTALLFVAPEQADLIDQHILDKPLIRYVIDHLRLSGSEKIILPGNFPEKYPDVVQVNDAEELRKELNDSDGKLIITNLNYPNLDATVYATLYLSHAEAGALFMNGENTGICVMKSALFDDYASLQYEALKMAQEDLVKVNTIKDLPALSRKIKEKINYQHLANGVQFIDIDHTYIGEDVTIGKGTILYPNVYLEGHTKIGNNCTITSNSHLIDSIIGDECQIMASRITDSVLHDHIKLGPYSHLRMNCEVMDGARIGNFVEFKKTKFGKISRCAHLTYLGDSTVGEDVNIGCGVITVNYDGAHKFNTIIKDKAFIGSNSNLIAPVTVGESALVAAGSTVTKDVAPGDMAIGRVRQETKVGFGYKYINKEK